MVQHNVTAPLVRSIRDIEPQRSVWFVDIWGVLHDGVRPFAEAVEACRQFRQRKGCVVLVSNSPRLRAGVIAQLDSVGVPRDVYDDVVTSGDVSRSLVANLGQGAAIYHLGPDRDRALFDGLDVELTKTVDATAIVCTGLIDDETETPETYADILADFAGRGAPLVCANPDIKVVRDGRLIFCAGAIAAAYEALSGRVTYAGKPYAPIYDAALDCAARHVGARIAPRSVLAIGDGASTDIRGAARAGIAAVYVASAVDLVDGELTAQAIARLFPRPDEAPIAIMQALEW